MKLLLYIYKRDKKQTICIFQTSMVVVTKEAHVWDPFTQWQNYKSVQRTNRKIKTLLSIRDFYIGKLALYPIFLIFLHLITEFILERENHFTSKSSSTILNFDMCRYNIVETIGVSNQSNPT